MSGEQISYICTATKYGKFLIAVGKERGEVRGLLLVAIGEAMGHGGYDDLFEAQGDGWTIQNRVMAGQTMAWEVPT